MTSLILELNLFRDSDVEPRRLSEQVIDTTAASSLPAAAQNIGHRERAKARVSKAKEGLWSYIAKQSETILGRVRTISHDSLSQKPIPSATAATESEVPKTPPLLPFTAEMKAVEEASGVLSTTPGLRFPPPALLQEIAEKETKSGYSDVTASQNAGLQSILGWSLDHHLSGRDAFLRHQCITVLYSEYVPVESAHPDEEKGSGQSTASSTPCVQRKWRTYRYYSRAEDEDTSLGEFIIDRCIQASQECTASKCKFKGHAHQLRWITGRTRVNAKLRMDPSPKGGINMWISCQECKASTIPQPMSNGTW